MAERIQIVDIKLLTMRVVEEVGVLEPAWNVGGQMKMQRGGGIGRRSSHGSGHHRYWTWGGARVAFGFEASFGGARPV
jgi:hypothetical protein